MWGSRVSSYLLQELVQLDMRIRGGKQVEYSLTKPDGERLEFDTFFKLMTFLSKVGSVKGWILVINHV